jgi:hypothetical protein
MAGNMVFIPLLASRVDEAILRDHFQQVIFSLKLKRFSVWKNCRNFTSTEC